MVEVTRLDQSTAIAQDDPRVFDGTVLAQGIVHEENAPDQRVTAITFVDGARNRWHWHSTEQVLVVTAGNGIVADSNGEYPISVGDVVLIQPNERHWHGAQPGGSMTHLSILLPGSMTVDDDQEG